MSEELSLEDSNLQKAGPTESDVKHSDGSHGPSSVATFRHVSILRGDDELQITATKQRGQMINVCSLCGAAVKHSHISRHRGQHMTSQIRWAGQYWKHELSFLFSCSMLLFIVGKAISLLFVRSLTKRRQPAVAMNDTVLFRSLLVSYADTASGEL